MTATLLKPDCDPKSFKDGRGVIIAFCPGKPIVEQVFNVITAGKVRGYHCHPEFDEIVTMASGIAVETVKEDGKETIYHLTPGVCLHIPAGLYHTFYAVTDCVAVMGLTKRWNDCEQPIIQEKQ